MWCHKSKLVCRLVKLWFKVSTEKLPPFNRLIWKQPTSVKLSLTLLILVLSILFSGSWGSSRTSWTCWPWWTTSKCSYILDNWCCWYNIVIYCIFPLPPSGSLVECLWIQRGILPTVRKEVQCINIIINKMLPNVLCVVISPSVRVFLVLFMILAVTFW